MKKITGGNDRLEPGKVAIRLQHLSVVIFTEGMDKVNWVRQDAWAKSFAFTADLRNYINDLSAKISLGGGNNSSDVTRVTQGFIKKLQEDLNSEEFEKNMMIARPNTDDQTINQAWEAAFNFPKILKECVTEMEKMLERNNGSMNLGTFVATLNLYLDKIEKKVKS